MKYSASKAFFIHCANHIALSDPYIESVKENTSA